MFLQHVEDWIPLGFLPSMTLVSHTEIHSPAFTVLHPSQSLGEPVTAVEWLLQIEMLEPGAIPLNAALRLYGAAQGDVFDLTDGKPVSKPRFRWPKQVISLPCAGATNEWWVDGVWNYDETGSGAYVEIAEPTETGMDVHVRFWIRRNRWVG